MTKKRLSTVVAPSEDGNNSWRSAPLEVQTSYEPRDWSTDDGARVDGSARRITVNGGSVSINSATTAPESLSSAPSSRAGNSFRDRATTPVQSLEAAPTTPPGSATVRPLTLYGKNIMHIVPISSAEATGTAPNTVDWSDTFDTDDAEDNISIRDPHFDLTNGKISKLFALSNPNDKGTLAYESFRCGLEAMGIVCDNDQQFQAFVSEVDDDRSDDISYEEFLCAIQEIKLAQLFNDNFIRTMPQLNTMRSHRLQPTSLGSIEYCPDRIRSVYPINQIKSFIYSTKPNWAAVRWINVEGVDSLLMRRLSVRYRLHPLAVEDIIGPDMKRAKYVKYEHSFLLLQTLHAHDVLTVKDYQSMFRASKSVLPGDRSPFDLMTQTELISRLEELEIGRVMTLPEQLSLFVMEGVLISVQASGANTLWPALKQRLHISYSKVRQHSTAFLVYTILDVCVDELWPISQTFGAKLLMLERLMSLESRYFDLARIAAFTKQIKGLKMHCKPMREVISKLIASNDYQGETLQYFTDVQEHLSTIEEECEHRLDRCRSLVEEFNNDRASQQNDVSYILALIAAIFLPAQFMTGVYGMNFPYIPELKYYYGYFIWWAVMLVVAGLVALFFKFKRWL